MSSHRITSTPESITQAIGRFAFDIVGAAGSNSADHNDTGGTATMARLDGGPDDRMRKLWFVRTLKDETVRPPPGWHALAVCYPSMWYEFYDCYYVDMSAGDMM